MEAAHLATEAFAILFGLTLIRWSYRTWGKNEFNREGNTQSTTQICKFCQIIDSPENLVFKDDRVAIFEDKNSGKDAQKHLLVCPTTHIKDCNQL